jgi:hypothetical protein
MGNPGADAAVCERLLEFAEEIGLVPIPVRKEQSGYVINSMLVPWCTAALELLVRGVSDFQSIDRTWMITLQSGMGPFGDDGSDGPWRRVPRRKAARRDHPETPRRSSPPAISRSTHAEGPPRGRERRGLLSLSESGIRAAGIYLNRRELIQAFLLLLKQSAHPWRVVWAATLRDDGPRGGFFRDGKPLDWLRPAMR